MDGDLFNGVWRALTYMHDGCCLSGTKFHRIIKGFMCQGQEGVGEPVPVEPAIPLPSQEAVALCCCGGVWQAVTSSMGMARAEVRGGTAGSDDDGRDTRQLRTQFARATLCHQKL